MPQPGQWIVDEKELDATAFRAYCVNVCKGNVQWPTYPTVSGMPYDDTPEIDEDQAYVWLQQMFGELTREDMHHLIRQFQSCAGLVCDGALGQVTWGVLYAAMKDAEAPIAED